jgi:hypothetical protein
VDFQPIESWSSLNIGLYGVHSRFHQNKEESSFTQLSLDVQTRLKEDWKNLKIRFLNSYFMTEGFSEGSFLYEDIFHSQLIVNYQF